MREKLGLNSTVMDIIVTMSEGNPGAIRVLSEIIQRPGGEGLILILGLDDMNVRGSQVWVGYKDHCGEDIDAFAKAIKTRDPEMVAKINEQCSYSGEIAVASGASFKR